MKKLVTFIAVLLLLSTLTTNAQETAKSEGYSLAKESWAFGFGLSYPRWFGSTLRPLEDNFGGFLSIERNFTEHSGLRLKGFFRSVNGRIPGGMYSYSNGTLVPSGAEEARTTLMGADLTYLYHLSPVESVSPYFLAGAGAEYSNPDWGNVVNPQAKSSTSFHWVLGGGVNWDIAKDWQLSTEVALTSVSSTAEGVIDNNRNGIFGSNGSSYLTIDIGGLYYFGKGEPSNLTQLYNGINVDVPETDYERIENIVKKNVPREVVKEVVVPTPVKNDNWVLVGCTFNFNKATLKKEAEPILWHATQVLLSNPDVKVEIQGYTDGIGSDNYNLKLSEKRAQAVKDYLAARGIAADRMTVKGYGKANPVASNDTAEGRALNRRIEFKVMN